VKNLVNNFIAFFIIFSVVFNINSFSYANTDKITEIKPLFAESFVLKPDYSSLKISVETGGQPGANFFLNINQAFFGAVFSGLAFLPVYGIILIILVLTHNEPNAFTDNILFSTACYLLYALLNSFFVFAGGKNLSERSYFLTLAGSMTGIVLYLSFMFLLVYIEAFVSADSYTLDSNRTDYLNREQFLTISRGSPLDIVQPIAFYLIMPVFVSSVSTLFYYFYKKPAPEEIAVSPEPGNIEFLQETIRFSSKFKINNGSISFNIVKF
jgi:hypothetical protein